MSQIIRVLKDKNLAEWLGKAMPEAESFGGMIFEEHCPHCHRAIRFPSIVRERDIEAMKNILDEMAEYAGELGIPEKVLAVILKRINNRLNLQ